MNGCERSCAAVGLRCGKEAVQSATKSSTSAENLCLVLSCLPGPYGSKSPTTMSPSSYISVAAVYVAGLASISPAETNSGAMMDGFFGTSELNGFQIGLSPQSVSLILPSLFKMMFDALMPLNTIFCE